MELTTLLNARRSLRRYAGRPVDRATILDCLEAARIAPSSENIQPWRFIIIDDPELLEKVATEASSGVYLPTKFIRKAPVIIAVLAETDILVNRIGAFLQGTQFYLLDLGIACQQLVLRAEDLGLGSCYVGWFNVGRTRAALGLRKKEKIVCLIALGYPDPATPRPAGHKRKPLAELVRFNRD